MQPDWKLIRFIDVDRAQFHAGGWRQWANECPKLFDSDDRRKVRIQAGPPYNRWFFEWLAARTIYLETEYLSLIARYASRNTHPTKWQTFQRIAPASVLALLTTGRRNRLTGTLGPDLFVYKSDESDWFLPK